ncbi:hypothetical protein J6590_010771 [Homalodisca vitripennis]|nr:hypothetical protein J6590_010771 [Homalodisca vitripennis]
MDKQQQLAKEDVRGADATRRRRRHQTERRVTRNDASLPGFFATIYVRKTRVHGFTSYNSGGNVKKEKEAFTTQVRDQRRYHPSAHPDSVKCPDKWRTPTWPVPTLF